VGQHDHDDHERPDDDGDLHDQADHLAAFSRSRLPDGAFARLPLGARLGDRALRWPRPCPTPAATSARPVRPRAIYVARMR